MNSCGQVLWLGVGSGAEFKWISSPLFERERERKLYGVSALKALIAKAEEKTVFWDGSISESGKGEEKKQKDRSLEILYSIVHIKKKFIWNGGTSNCVKCQKENWIELGNPFSRGW